MSSLLNAPPLLDLKDLHPQPHRGTRVIPPTGEVQMRDLSPFTRHSAQWEEGEEVEMEGETYGQSMGGERRPLNTSPSSSPVRRLPRGQRG